MAVGQEICTRTQTNCAYCGGGAVQVGVGCDINTGVSVGPTVGVSGGVSVAVGVSVYVAVGVVVAILSAKGVQVAVDSMPTPGTTVGGAGVHVGQMGVHVAVKVGGDVEVGVCVGVDVSTGVYVGDGGVGVCGGVGVAAIMPLSNGVAVDAVGKVSVPSGGVPSTRMRPKPLIR